MLCVIALFYQARGIDDRNKLPYFPYRDDGEIIYKAIEDLMKDIVNLWVQINHLTTDTPWPDSKKLTLATLGLRFNSI